MPVQFRGLVCGWLSRGGCGCGSGTSAAACLGHRQNKKKKCGGKLESCSKSQSFFAGINLVQAGGGSGASVAGEKSQTLTTTTTLPDSAAVGFSYIGTGTLLLSLC